MKRFATTVAICTALLVGVGAYANNLTWNGATDATWHTIANWTGSGFPGSGSRVRDRVVINICENGGVDFTTSSGDTSFSSFFDSRIIAELLLDASADAKPVALVVSGAVLMTPRLVMKSGTTAQIARLHVSTSDDVFRPERLDIIANTASGANVQIKVDSDLKVGEETRIDGRLDVDIAAGQVFDMGRLVCVSCTIASATVTVPATCP